MAQLRSCTSASGKALEKAAVYHDSRHLFGNSRSWRLDPPSVAHMPDGAQFEAEPVRLGPLRNVKKPHHYPFPRLPGASGRTQAYA